MSKDVDEKREESSPLIRRLNAIIALLVLRIEKDEGEKIQTLSDAGLRSFEIAEILGKSSSYIRGELSRRRSAKKKPRS